MSEIKSGKSTSEFGALTALGVKSKYVKILQALFAIFGVLAPLYLDKLDAGSTAAIVITAILALAAKFGFESHAVGKYAMGRSIVKAAELNPPRES